MILKNIQKNYEVEDARYRALRLLEKPPEMSQRQLAHEIGISLGRLHFLLRALVDKGFVKLGNFSASEDKRRYAYILTSIGLREKRALTADFLARITVEYETLRREIAAVRASAKTSSIAPGEES